jgi:septum formation protein
VLASSSPRRRTLLRQIGVEPDVRPAGLAEDLRPGEEPRDHVRRLAEAKGRSVAPGLAASPAGLILSADTVVVIDGHLLGKPADPEEATGMLRRLSGRTHDVLTAMWLARTDDARCTSWVESTRVRFRSCPEALVRWYVATGEPFDKAGAYGIQGRGALLVDGIEGSWTNVVGLPVERLPDLLDEIGVDWMTLLPGLTTPRETPRRGARKPRRP